jgi:hypothetical protein
MNTGINPALSLHAVPDIIASEPDGKAAALLTVSDLDPSRAAAVLRKVADDLRRDVAEGRPVKGPLVYLGMVAERHEALFGPFGGRHGPPVVCAMFLRDRWDHFSAWLEERGIDPAPCRTWLESRLNLLKVAQAVTTAGAEKEEDDDGRRYLAWLRKEV